MNYRRILLITGKLAKNLVEKQASKFNNVDVYVVNKEVAALITTKDIENIDLSKYDLVLLPGLAKGNWKKLEKLKGVKIRLGPIHACDIEFILRNIDKVELSHDIPACKLLENSTKDNDLRTLAYPADFAFKIRDIKIGGDSRIKVISEIQNATEINDDELKEKIDYLQKFADIIDLSIPNESSYDQVRRAIKIALDYSSVPISVDTTNPKFLILASELGTDLLLSLTYNNFSKVVDKISKEQAVVVAEKSLNLLLTMINKLREIGFCKIIADCLLDPPMYGLTFSIKRYVTFREKDKDTPLLMGVGNVTELCDVDSTGVNGLLTFIAEEIGVNLLLTTEASPKTHGSTKELKIATYMSKISKRKKKFPKDMYFNLLSVKEKKRIESKTEKVEKMIIAEGKKTFKFDPKGYFKIWLEKGKIFCKHSSGVTIVGSSADDILSTIISNNLISNLEHAAYLGKELTKAEIALKLNKNYVQDLDLNFGIYTNFNNFLVSTE